MRYNVFDPPKIDSILGNQYLVPTEESYGHRHRRKLITCILQNCVFYQENAVVITFVGMYVGLGYLYVICFYFSMGNKNVLTLQI